MSDSRYFIAKGKHLVVPVTKQEYEDYWNKKRKESMTNEEWRKTCSAEEFAEWMAQYCCDVDTSDVKEILKKEWLKWLKQPHREIK